MERKYWEPEIETAPIGKLREIQLEKLKSIVERAYEETAIYRKKFDQAGVKPGDIKVLDDIRKLPLTSSLEELAPVAPEERLAVPKDKVVRIECTSGTTGAPRLIFLTKEDLEWWRKTFARYAVLWGIKEDDIVQFTYTVFQVVPGFEAVGAKIIPGDWATSLPDNQVRLLASAGTTALMSTPAQFLQLMARADALGVDLKKTKLRTVILGGESWSDSYRDKMERELGITFRELYGLMETCDFAGECTARGGLHIWDDLQVLEIIDPDTEEVLPPGEFGEIVVTPLWVEGMPVIRYRTGDMAKMLEYEPCPCGRTFNKISRIKGRTAHVIKVRDTKLFPIDVEEVIQSLTELGGEYQIIVEKPGPLDILKVKAEYKSEVKEIAKLKRKVEMELGKATAVKSEIELVPYGKLPRAAMKAQRIIRTY